MLHEFLSANRDELIRRCQSKVRRRDTPAATPTELDNGVPLLYFALLYRVIFVSVYYYVAMADAVFPFLGLLGGWPSK